LSLVCLQVSGGNAAVRRWWMLALAAAGILTGGAGLLSRTVGVELMGILSSTLTLAWSLLCAPGCKRMQCWSFPQCS
jgi:L-lactate permease